MGITWAKPLPINMGRREQYLRLAIGVVFIMMSFMVSSGWFWPGLYSLFTGMAGSSPFYFALELLGVRRRQFPRT